MISTIATVPIEQYAAAYDFKVSTREASDLEPLAQLVAEETYPARKAVLTRELADRRNAKALGLEEISIGVKYSEFGSRYLSTTGYEITSNDLYLGGIERRLTYTRIQTPGDWTQHNSIYIGPLPEWVRVKYEEAKRYFPVGRLAVVSRCKEFFDIQTQSRIDPALRLSPLLLAFDMNDKVYLLAAWGLEYELPASLGGKLPG